MLEEVVGKLKNCSKVVVLTGAGISAESGVPTFRGKEGLWGKFKPEQLASMDAFMSNPKIVWEWYNWRRELIAKVKPNAGHVALVNLENMIAEFTLVTQNVDNLHVLAGSKSILELHGNIYRNKCMDCSALYEDEGDINPERIPTCSLCNGKIRPDIVWFGEMLDSDIINRAFLKAEEAELFFVVGTSALVHPAATLPIVAQQHGAILVEINVERTALSDIVDFHFEGKSGQFLPKLVELLKEQIST